MLVLGAGIWGVASPANGADLVSRDQRPCQGYLCGAKATISCLSEGQQMVKHLLSDGKSMLIIKKKECSRKCHLKKCVWQGFISGEKLILTLETNLLVKRFYKKVKAHIHFMTYYSSGSALKFFTVAWWMLDQSRQGLHRKRLFPLGVGSCLKEHQKLGRTDPK